MSARQLRELKTAFAGDAQPVFRQAIEGHLRRSSIRGLAWRYFLGSLSGAPATWGAQQRAAQAAFDTLGAEHAVDLDVAGQAAADAELDLAVNNPLSTDAASPYAKYFEGTTLREEITRDLERLHPGNAFFARSDVQRLLLRVLFLWARAHPELSYRQGMHELLAPIVSTLWAEADEASEAREAPSTPAPPAPPHPSSLASLFAGGGDGAAAAVDGIHSARLNEFPAAAAPPAVPTAEDDASVAMLREVVAPAHVEASAWHLFCQLMRSVRPWFEMAPRPAVVAKRHNGWADNGNCVACRAGSLFGFMAFRVT